MELRKIGIAGAGVMGKSIAHKAADAGLEVVVVDLDERRASAGRAQLEARLDRELAKWGITEAEKKVILSRVDFTADVERLSDVDLAIETTPEELAVKKRVVSDLDRVSPPGTVVITNTSALSVTEIASACESPEVVVGMHFLYPATETPLVEVVRGMRTSDEAVAVARQLASTLDKEVVEVVEYPGYVVTRAIMPFVNEAMHIVMEGIAPAEDVDRALRLGYELKLGPLEYADRVGLDKVMAWMENLWRELGELKYRPCPLLRQLVRARHLGRKSGRGFFEYDEHGRRVPGSGVRQ